MATPTPEGLAGEAFAESAAEAVQTAVMAVRLVMAIADAVRRHQLRKAGKQEELPPVEEAVAKVPGDVKKLMPSDISAALLQSADWPQLAQQMMALQQAGVDLGVLLPRIGEVAVLVQESVAANQARVAREGTGQWEKLLRETMPAGPVREAIVSSPTWPDIAAQMAKVNGQGVDVRQILASAHEEGLGVDQALRKVLAAGEAPKVSRDVLLSYGPMTEGLDLPGDLRLDDRVVALHQLAISPSENARFVRMVKEALPDHAREVDLMVVSKQWPLVAARMAAMESANEPVAKHLEGLAKDTSWQQGREMPVSARLAQATVHVLRHPPGEAPPMSSLRVSSTAAKARSTTVGPTRVQAAKGATPAEPGVAAHRQEPAAKTGKKTR